MINGSHSEHGPGKNGFIKKKSENYRGCKPRDAPLLRFMKSNYKKYRAKAASQAQYEKTFIINESLFLSAIFRLEIKILPRRRSDLQKSDCRQWVPFQIPEVWAP